MWKRKRKAEWLPWYRARNYKGDMTEAEKRQLDAFRMQPTHPAVQWDDLPEEVQKYVSRIEVELYDHKQQQAAGRSLFFCAVGVLLLFLNYKGCLGDPTIWSYVGAVLLLVLPWFVYRYEWNKNAEEFLPSDAPYGVTEERIREEWELNYIVSRRVEQRRAEGDAASPS
jgi:hypothetical protein